VNKRLLPLFALLLLVPAAHAQSRRRAALPPPLQQASPCSQATLFLGAGSADVEVDATHVYFTDDLGSLYRMPKGSPAFTQPQLLGSVPDYIVVLALDDTNVYLLTTEGGFADGAVWSIPKTGGNAQQLVSGILTAFELAVDANNVYWVSVGTPTGSGFLADGKVEKVKKDGNGRTTLASNLNLPTSVASDGTNVYYGETGLSTGNSSKGLRSVPVNGGSVRKLTTNDGTVALTLNGNDIYYASLDFFTGGELLRMPKTGGNSTSLAKNVDVVTHMTVAGDKLYFFNSDDVQSIDYVPIAGGARKTAVGGEFLAQEFAVDDCALYSVDAFGSINRTPR